MKDDYNTNSRYTTYAFSLEKVRRMYFLSSGVKGLMSISTVSNVPPLSVPGVPNNGNLPRDSADLRWAAIWCCIHTCQATVASRVEVKGEIAEWSLHSPCLKSSIIPLLRSPRFPRGATTRRTTGSPYRIIMPKAMVELNFFWKSPASDQWPILRR